MIALINNFKTYYLKNDLLQLTLIECAFTYGVDVIEVERVVGLDVILVIWKQVIVALLNSLFNFFSRFEPVMLLSTEPT